ncbi:FAD/NAD(P)-dependent oxidoreductase [Pseudomonas fulva]|nr:NAD(P)/FAD-dependent oxidoreductase [Pseudomonas fulva]MBF8778625.1 FAD-dependent oxidoreductase [Pseudomonas fulva]
MSAAPVIVGAGTAGMAAAMELAEHGLGSVLIDEAPRPGGVVYRGPLRAGIDIAYLGARYRKALEKLQADFARHAGLVDLRLRSRVMGGEAGRLIVLDDQEKLQLIDYPQLLLATGCHERVVPFSGWTLPGVMLLGGLQLQIKSAVARPLGRTVLAGSGPLLPLVACQLHAAGAPIAGVYEACAFGKIARQTLALMNKPQLFLDGLSMLAYMRLHEIPMHHGWGIVAAWGEESLQRVTVAPYTEQWEPRLDLARDVAAQTLALGYGFIPRTQLSQQMSLEHAFSPDGQLQVVSNAWQQASQPNIHVAGDMAGIQGGEAAMLTGRIAATSILHQRGVLEARQALERRERYLAKLAAIRRFRRGVERYTSRGPAQLDLARCDTVICRCEHVLRGDIDRALAQGVRDMTSLKLRTRIGLGDCQGRLCAGYCSDRLRASSGQSDVGWLRPRFPIDLLPLCAFDSAAREERS